MNFKEVVNDELAKISRLINQLDDNMMNPSNTDNHNENANDFNINNICTSIKKTIYKVNHLKIQLEDSLHYINQTNQLYCSHNYQFDNKNYEPMQLVCTKCHHIYH